MSKDDLKRIKNNIDCKVESIIDRVIGLSIYYYKKKLSDDEVRLLVKKFIKGNPDYQYYQTALYELEELSSELKK